ncbi:cupin [Rhizocola hellebori]|uniref:Cupin n=1 Tax=Rhizocola hellebori TaxID=1392758 RepID=A0A8J3VGT3_9ACTN|nr:cupin domain-containing protein [Rhizocola hellebori]GIH05218.1 cupin [Rhizocola hellebori]
MSTASRSFNDANEVRTPPNAQVDVVQLGEVKVARFTLQPGWRWSLSVKPIVGTETCQARHIGAVVAGHMRVEHADGTKLELGPGDAYLIEPGHDAWVEGTDVFIGYEFDGATAATFAADSES